MSTEPLPSRSLSSEHLQELRGFFLKMCNGKTSLFGVAHAEEMVCLLDEVIANRTSPSETAYLAYLGCKVEDGPADPAAAMVKLFGKMDEQDMATLNWIIKGRAAALSDVASTAFKGEPEAWLVQHPTVTNGMNTAYDRYTFGNEDKRKAEQLVRDLEENGWNNIELVPLFRTSHYSLASSAKEPK